MMKSTRRWRHVAFSCLAGIPAGGFLFGLLHAGDPDPNIIGRLCHAGMVAALTPLHAGLPPCDVEGVRRVVNVWPHIAVASLLIFSGLVLRDRATARRRPSA
jgi:hypothetical protein